MTLAKIAKAAKEEKHLDVCRPMPAYRPQPRLSVYKITLAETQGTQRCGKDVEFSSCRLWFLPPFTGEG